MRIPLLPLVVSKYWPLSLFAFLIFISCGRRDAPPVPAPPATPKALQDESDLKEVGFVSKSSRGTDLVESLYQELVKKDSTLAALEEGLDGLPEKRADSVKLFNDYDGKNNGYYGSAKSHIGEIKDSLLRRKMEALIAESDTAYKAMTAHHRGLLAEWEKRQLSMDDLHEVLKLTRTLPVIQQYQKRHLPGTSPLQHILEAYEGMVRQEERLVKR